MTIGRYYSFDPGYRTGFASFDEKGELTGLTILEGPQLDIFLGTAFLRNPVFMSPEPPPTTFIYEDFILEQSRPGADQTGSRMPACLAIGKIQLVGNVINAEMVPRPRSQLYSGLIKAGYKYSRGQHPRDDHAAHAHGENYLILKKVKKNRIFKEREYK